MLEHSEIAFEEGIEGTPTELWRVVSLRRGVRMIHWFQCKSDAEERMDWIENQGGRIASVYRYCLASNEAEGEW